jgi:hypothetical protein
MDGWMQKLNLSELSVLTKKKVEYIVVERTENQAKIAIFGKVGAIKGVNVEPKIFQKRTLSENFQTLNNFYNDAERAVEALEDISTVLSDYSEIIRDIKTLSERILKIRESYIRLLEKIKNLKNVQSTIYVREAGICDFCGKYKETYPYNGFSFCKECLDFVSERNIPKELISEKIRLTNPEIELLKQIHEKNPMSGELLHEILSGADKWEAYTRLLRKGYVSEDRKKFPPLIKLTERGKRLTEIC